MGRLIATAAALAVVLGGASRAAAEETVTVRGIVLEVHPWRTHDDGPLLLVVMLKGEGPWRARLVVRPDDEKAYATVGGLTRGDKVAVVCTGGDENYWIKEITREGHVDIGPRREDPREREERMRREEEERMRRERGERGEDRPREPDNRDAPHHD